MDTISKLLGEGVLPPELASSLQEAFDKKVAESKASAEESIREEFARRYEHDKNNLIEAMDRMITDALTKQESEKAATIEKFTEARNAFRKAVRENRSQFKNKLTETIDRSKSVVVETLSREVASLRLQKKKLVQEGLKAARRLEAITERHDREQSDRIKKIDKFVIEQTSKELSELNENAKGLLHARAKLLAEGRNKLRETQKRFVQEAAKKTEAAVHNTLKREMSQLHEDLERNRQNMFGRRMFETFAAEYLNSYLSEGSDLKKLQQVLESKEKELGSVKSKLNEATKDQALAQRKAKLAEDRAVRSKVMTELLSPLRGEKRSVMEGMLETVKTTALRETFSKLLPVVIDETSSKTSTPARKPLVERRETRSVTGNSQNRLYETIQAENNEFDTSVAELLRLSGVKTN